MVAMWLSLVGAMLLAFNLAVMVPEQEHQRTALVADVAATNFFAYRSAVINYMNANPSASGTVADGALTFLPGYIRDARWTNVIQGGTLYVYSTGTESALSVMAMFRLGANSLLIGKKTASGKLVSANGMDTGIALPAAIATGAIVVVGR